MTVWSEKELHRIKGEEYLRVAAILADGSASRWVSLRAAPVGDRLFVRVAGDAPWDADEGPAERGRIRAAGLERDVALAAIPPEDEATIAAVDASFRGKYSGSPSARVMSSEPARHHTLEVLPA